MNVVDLEKYHGLISFSCNLLTGINIYHDPRAPDYEFSC